VPGDASTPVRGQLEVRLEVPNLGQAVGFYSNIFAACPTAVERRMVWFAVPDSTFCIELREPLTPTPTRLRLCTEPHRPQRVAAELSRFEVTVAQAELTREASARAISFHDPGRNHWELYTTSMVAPRRHGISTAKSPDPGAHSPGAPRRDGRPRQGWRPAFSRSELTIKRSCVVTANNDNQLHSPERAWCKASRFPSWCKERPNSGCDPIRGSRAPFQCCRTTLISAFRSAAASVIQGA
jgi:hypothetical protein